MTSKENRRLKRRWLHAIGAIKIDSRAASSSSIVPLTQSLVDETLGLIQGDENNLWVANACLDAVFSGLPPLQDDPILLRKILILGARSTDSSTRSGEDVLKGPEQTLQLLALRTTLLRLLRLFNVWNKVYGPEADRFASRWEIDTGKDDGSRTTQKEEEEEHHDCDAWAELAETTPSPIAPKSMRTSALTFILSSPIGKAMELAMAGQALQLSSFLRALPQSLITEVFPKRYSIIKALLLSSAVLQSDLTVLIKSDILPTIRLEREADIWTRIRQSSEEKDFSDLPGIQRLLQEKRLLSQDANFIGSREETFEDALDPEAVMRFYINAIWDIEQQTGSIFFAAQLANFITSDAFGSKANQEVQKLSDDVHLFLSLVQGRATSSEAKRWSLQNFRKAFQSSSDPSAIVNLASLYLENAQNQFEATEALQAGIIPLFRASILRIASTAVDKVTLESEIRSRLISLYLFLAEKGKVSTLSYLLLSDEGLNLDKKAQILLAIVLTSEVTDRRTLDVLQNMLNTLGSSMVNIGGANVSESIKRLRDVITSTFNRATTFQPKASMVYDLFNGSTIAELASYLHRAQACQQAAMRLSIFVESIRVGWLAILEGDRDEQLAAVTRLIRSFSRNASHAQMYSQFANTLSADAGPRQAFDQITPKHVAKIVLEGASRIGDIYVFDQVLRSETNNVLIVQEQEDIIVDASEELYDNSNSANLHQGDMKMAYDLLSRVPNANTSKRVQQFKSFIEATSRLCSFRVPSKINANALLLPIEIRLSVDRLDLIRRLLGTRSDAYRTPEMILDVAYKLCAVPPGARGDSLAKTIPHKSLVENSTLAMLTDAALSQSDFASAQNLCEKLVTNALNLGKRVEQSRSDQSGNLAMQTFELYEEVTSLAHRTCHQLSKQPDWTDYASRLRWAGFALTFCPADQLSKYMETWRMIAHEFEQELQANPPKIFLDELQRGGLSRGAISATSLGGGLSAALQASTGGLSAAGFAALSQFGGSLESYANPLGALFSRGPSAIRPLASSLAAANTTNLNRSGSQTSTSSGQNIHSVVGTGIQGDLQSMTNERGSPISRAAKLFDGLGASGHADGQSSSGHGAPSEGMPAYMDPAERAARAARRFFSGFGAG